MATSDHAGKRERLRSSLILSGGKGKSAVSCSIADDMEGSDLGLK